MSVIQSVVLLLKALHMRLFINKLHWSSGREFISLLPKYKQLYTLLLLTFIQCLV